MGLNTIIQNTTLKSHSHQKHNILENLMTEILCKYYVLTIMCSAVSAKHSNNYLNSNSTNTEHSQLQPCQVCHIVTSTRVSSFYLNDMVHPHSEELQVKRTWQAHPPTHLPHFALHHIVVLTPRFLNPLRQLHKARPVNALLMTTITLRDSVTPLTLTMTE